MNVTQKTYTAPPFVYILLTYELANKQLLAVHRDGIEYDLISEATFLSQGAKCTGRQAWHYAPSGVIYFDYNMPFNGDIFGTRSMQERVNVIYIP